MPRLVYVLMLWSACAAAQTVEGNVVNSVTGRGIAGVKVSLSRANDSFYSATTDTQGHFLFDQVQDGPYTVSYSSPDYFYEPKGPRQFQVTAGAGPVKLEARMTPLAQALRPRSGWPWPSRFGCRRADIRAEAIHVIPHRCQRKVRAARQPAS